MHATSPPASADEFGIWYQQEASDAPWRFVCPTGARVLDPSRLDLAEAVDVLGEVLVGHPEAGARFAVDAQGGLVKHLGGRGERRPEVVCFPVGDDLDTSAARLRSLPISLETGDLVRLAVQPDERGRPRHLFAAAHHIVWDVRSEEGFWAAVDRCVAARVERRAPGSSAPHRTVPSEGAATEPDRPAPDPQHRTLFGDGARLWSSLSAAARMAGVTRFAWVVGHLATAVAGWSPLGAVVVYVDVDRRPLLDPAPTGLGFFQTQREIAAIDRGSSGSEAARRVHGGLGALLAGALSGEIRPQPERSADGAQPCKIYLRDVRSRHRLRHVRPLDLPTSVARNQLQVGLTVDEQAIEVVVTARSDVATWSGVADLADRTERALAGAAVGV